MGPAGSRIVRGDMDVRPGGTYHYGLVVADGVEMWGLQAYREVVQDERIVHVQSFSDPHRGLARHPLAATWPRLMLAKTTFEDEGPGRTKITVSWAPHDSDATEDATFSAAHDGMRGGFGGMFDTLDRHLAETEAEITFSRLVDAAPAAVWRAFTDPAEVNAWWGPTASATRTSSRTCAWAACDPSRWSGPTVPGTSTTRGTSSSWSRSGSSTTTATASTCSSARR
jgi:uncharacterized protein YndB with AHSA1/START domain